MSEKKEKCEIEYVPDPTTGWKLKLKGDCSETLQKIDDLPPRKRGYVKRRIVV